MDIWNAEKSVYADMKKLVGKYHARLALVVDEIAIVFREKASTPGGVVILGKSKKAPPVLGILTDKKWKFIIELAADEWNNLTEKQRAALLDHHLCSLLAEEDAQSGELKTGIKPPDFMGYREEIERHGMWRPQSNPDGKSLVEQMFGDE